MQLTFIWQNPAFIERDWIADVFSSVAGEQITDGDHRIVRDGCLLIDSYLYARSADYYTQFRGKNACFSISPMRPMMAGTTSTATSAEYFAITGLLRSIGLASFSFR